MIMPRIFRILLVLPSSYRTRVIILWHILSSRKENKGDKEIETMIYERGIIISTMIVQIQAGVNGQV